jgi:hypothetical protein
MRAVRVGRLLEQKLRPVDQQAVDDGDVVEVVELVDERAHDGEVEAHVAQLLRRDVVLDDGDNVAADPVDVGVHGQVGDGREEGRSGGGRRRRRRCRRSMGSKGDGDGGGSSARRRRVVVDRGRRRRDGRRVWEV